MPEGKPAAAVRISDLHKSFGHVRAVDGVDLVVDEGEFFTMLGPSGSGKTTLRRVIGGFESVDRGRVEIFGVDMTRTPPYDRDVNTVFQNYALFPHMSVLQNVEYGLRVKRVPKPERAEQAEAALTMVGLAAMGSRKPDQLSGGQRQRVALARAIVNRPKVLLLDEPLGALDLKLRQEMQLELKRIQREAGITFIYVTHDQEEALTMSDRIAVFNQGRIEQAGTPVEIYEHPTTEYVAGFIGVSNMLDHGGLTYAVRPERIGLTVRSAIADDATAGLGAATAAGVIREVIYLGVNTRYSVELDDGRRVIVVRPNDRAGAAALPVGTEVTASWFPAHSHPLGPSGRTGTPTQEPASASWKG
jgi:putative spermidine/putrescine transport system ATP-binding protein